MDHFLSKIFNFVDEWIREIVRSNKNWGRWSDIVAVRLPDILIGVITLSKYCQLEFWNYLLFLLVLQYEAETYWKKERIKELISG